MISLCELKFTDTLTVAELNQSLESKVAQMKHAFPGYGVETILISGKPLPNWDKLKTVCDRAYTAEEMFRG